MTTRNVVTTKSETSVGDIASLLGRNGINRVPIAKDGKIHCFVSRANPLQTLASATQEVGAVSKADDSAIRGTVQSQLNTQPWTKLRLLNVIINDRTAELWSAVYSEPKKKATRVARRGDP